MTVKLFAQLVLVYVFCASMAWGFIWLGDVPYTPELHIERICQTLIAWCVYRIVKRHGL